MAEGHDTKAAALYRRARRLISGGTQLLSKRPELYLPEQWPAYYSRCKGAQVWDLDGRRFIDMTTCGIGSCLLGYADEDVDAAARGAIDRGTMCTLNCPAEVELAELLLAIHPWARQVRYGRCGGEAMAMAVRIARAHSGRDAVAICGYHGWCDWYLAANLAADHALDGHLLPGLQPAGVPRGLRGTAHTFRYNRVEELEAIVAGHGDRLAAVVMEPMRHDAPADGFLEKVRAVARRCGAALVFDEITSGWRYGLGGAHLKLGVEPDLAVFAKAMSNGYPMAAVIGTEPVMQAAQSTFISSTYWTEAIGPTAAIATIRKLRDRDVASHLRVMGERVQSGWRGLATRHGLKLHMHGQPALTGFAFDDGRPSQALRTLMTQLMLDRGYLAAGGFYPTLAHTPAIVDGYLAALDEAFAVLRQALDAGDVEKRLRGPVAHEGFSRLT